MIKKIDWAKICLFNLLIVAVLGVLMRYKIGFEFPYFDQKNLQHAHSHFAFSGWISLLLMVLMVRSVSEKVDVVMQQKFDRIFGVYLVSAYGMLIAFATQGYALFSIFFSVLALLASFIFSWYFYNINKDLKQCESSKWWDISLVFNILSTFGTFYLTYMMVTKSIEQHAYLASVYWYLHFQYNGWFFFACTGIFIHYLQTKNLILKSNLTVFRLFAWSCIPAYGLSVLWLNLSLSIYILIAIAAIAQFYALVLFVYDFVSSNTIHKLDLSLLGKLLLGYIAIALSVKISLQLGSTIPAISQFAFGFRPIVIAYLHLVLLAFTTVFLVSYLFITHAVLFTKTSILGLILFVIGVALNELVLAVQGVLSISYTVVPYINEMLFGVSVLILISLVLLNTTKKIESKSEL